MKKEIGSASQADQQPASIMQVHNAHCATCIVHRVS
jgi:hypothetical protein